MGNVVGKKKRKTGKGKSNDHMVALTSSKHLQVELPREIVEDLERPRTRQVAGVKDPAQEMYEKLKALDQPAVMVPKPWSEMDQILSRLKSSAATAQPRTPSFQSPVSKSHKKVVEEPPTIIDMGELMDGLDVEDSRRSVSRRPEELNIDPLEFIKTKPFNPRKVKSLEATLSFSTIHTVKELDGGYSKAAAKPETVENVLKRRGSPSRRPGNDMSSPAHLSNEFSRRSNDLTRRSSEILRRSSEIDRRSHEFQRRSSEQQRSYGYEIRRSNEFQRPSSEQHRSHEMRRSNEFQRLSFEQHRSHERRRSNEFQRRSSEEQSSQEIRRSAEFTSTRPFPEITFAHAEALRSFAVRG